MPSSPKTDVGKNKDNPINEFLFSPIRDRDCTFIVVNDLLIGQYELPFSIVNQRVNRVI